MTPHITQDEFFDAIARGDLEMVKTQLPGSANWGMEVSAGMKLMGGGLRMPLHHAAIFGQTDVARLLVEAGAELNPKDKSLATPLLLAAEGKHTELAFLLLEAGTNPDIAGSVGDTALMFAATTKNYALAEKLAVMGANINAVADNGSTALHHAAGSKDMRMMALLIHLGIDETIKNDAGHTAAGQDANLNAFIEGCTERRREQQEFIQNQVDMVRNGSDAAVTVRKPLVIRKPAP